MNGWSYWKLGLLVVASYTAVMALVRLMLRRRAELAGQLGRDFDRAGSDSPPRTGSTAQGPGSADRRAA